MKQITLLRAKDYQRVSLVGTALSKCFKNDSFSVSRDGDLVRLQVATPNFSTLHSDTLRDWTTYLFRQLAPFFSECKQMS